MTVMKVAQDDAAQPFLSGVTDRQIFWSVMALAAVLRFIASIPFMVGWYDEIWQYLEPAWHLVEGPWVQTWDFRDGIRSWLIPEIVALPMGLGHAIAPDSDLHLLLPRLMMAGLSLVVVGCATTLGLRVSRLHGVLAGFISAIWFEFIFFAPRIMADSIAFSLMMGAIWLLLARQSVPQSRQFLLAGLLMGLCFVVRIQYAPTLLVLALFTAKRDWKQAWLPMITGGLIGLSIDAAANIAMGAIPFRWMWEAVRINIFEGRASLYGESPLIAYLGLIGIFWSLLLAPIFVMLARRGGRHYPVLMGMALVHLVVHSLIAHKEYRFILASTGLIIILAALASADLMRKVPSERFYRVGGGLLFTWMAASAVLGSGAFRPYWTFMKVAAENHQMARQTPNFCGVAIYFPKGSVSGSYALLREDKPIYAFEYAEDLAKHKTAFNAIATTPQLVSRLPTEYQIVRCADQDVSDTPACFARREGGCSSTAPEYHINESLRRSGN